MTPAASNPPLPPPPKYGTTLVDRMNLVVYLRRYLKLVGRRWLILFATSMLGLGFAVYKSKITPNVYRATSKLGFAGHLQGRTSADKLEFVDTPEVEAQTQQMKSFRVLGQVAEQMQPFYPKTEPVRIEATHVPGGFTLTVESTNLAYSERYAKVWAREFLNYKDALKEGTLTNQAALTRQERNKYDRIVEEKRTAINDFLKKNPEVETSRTVGDRSSVQRTLDEMRKELADKTTRRQKLERQTKEDLARGVVAENGSPTIRTNQPPGGSESDPLLKFSNSHYLDLQSQMRRKQSELAQWTPKLLPRHPKMIELNKELEDLKQQSEYELEQIDQKRLAEIKSLASEIAALEPLIKPQEDRVFAARRLQHEYDQLREEEETAKRMFEQFQRELTAIDVTDHSESRFWLDELDQGVGVPIPISPKRPQMILIGLLAGLCAGFGLIYFLHRLDDRLELAEEIESDLEEPILGQIPQMDRKEIRDGFLLITNMDQHNMFAEAIRGVRSAVIFGTQGINKQVLIVTSAVPGDGKTTFTVNFAATLANAGNRVLLVDADLRRGNTYNFFAQPRDPGLTEILTGEQHWGDTLRPTPIKTLSVIHSGRLPGNPGELLLGPVTKQFLDEAKLEFNHIIIDCPPLTAIDDTFSLVGHADGILFVVRAGQTSMRFAKSALAALRQRGAQVMGLVINGITSDNPSYYYAKNYHAYYTKALPGASAPSADSKPAAKMAARKTIRLGAVSIEAEAKVQAGQPVSTQEIVAEEQAKAETYKARRAGQKDPSD